MEISVMPYATPRLVSDPKSCDWYHTMEIPGYGLVEGRWDLGGRVDAYLGGINLTGKRVLELGPASGYLTFEMERRGAEVVAYDLSEEQSWDCVPMASHPYARHHAERRKAHIRRLNDGFWLAHHAFQSKAKVVYGDIYSIPTDIGLVDVAVFGAILLHLRDPFLGLEHALRLTRETAVVVDLAPWDGLSDGAIHFVPDSHARGPLETWWRFTPRAIQRMLGVLGFESAQVSSCTVPCMGTEHTLFTVVAQRTRPPLDLRSAQPSPKFPFGSVASARRGRL
jgi:SAM-dependent methyltransferase